MNNLEQEFMKEMRERRFRVYKQYRRKELFKAVIGMFSVALVGLVLMFLLMAITN